MLHHKMQDVKKPPENRPHEEGPRAGSASNSVTLDINHLSTLSRGVFIRGVFIKLYIHKVHIHEVRINSPILTGVIIGKHI